MNSHKNAPLTPKGREAMVRSVVEKGLSKAAAARQFNTTPKTVAKWVKRFSAEGVDGLRDRSSRPHSLPGQTPLATCSEIERLRRQRLTGKQIVIELEVSPATVSRVLCRLGLNRMRDLEPAEPVRRYERKHPGELIHIDIKKLGSSIGSGTVSPAIERARATPRDAVFLHFLFPKSHTRAGAKDTGGTDFRQTGKFAKGGNGGRRL